MKRDTTQHPRPEARDLPSADFLAGLTAEEAEVLARDIEKVLRRVRAGLMTMEEAQLIVLVAHPELVLAL